MWSCFVCDTPQPDSALRLESSGRSFKVHYFCAECGAPRADWLFDDGTVEARTKIDALLNADIPLLGTELLQGDVAVGSDGVFQFSADSSPYTFSIQNGQLQVALKKGN